ncbi:hypothetical protein THARTR1_11123 [Trichoderma harzianum]|uniref:Uncharacterized protein n=1 Tax=Trichoderma harzianum TaxID=5544 RepID=A0A2K0TD81_TRIHA|nr:hypothetical protein THARTR1_11123 [Trichoderma harzianum]
MLHGNEIEQLRGSGTIEATAKILVELRLDSAQVAVFDNEFKGKAVLAKAKKVPLSPQNACIDPPQHVQYQIVIVHIALLVYKRSTRVCLEQQNSRLRMEMNGGVYVFDESPNCHGAGRPPRRTQENVWLTTAQPFLNQSRRCTSANAPSEPSSVRTVVA